MFWIILLIFIGLIFLWHYSTKKYLNPYKFSFYFGKKGSGKSTLLVKHAYEYLKKGLPVYSTEYVAFTIHNKKTHQVQTVETIPIEAESIPYTPFPAGSVILIDEASLIWSNRDFSIKQKAEQLRAMSQFMQLQRRNKLIVEMYSVTFDIDKKIRDMCDDMYIVSKKFRVLVCAKHLIRKPIVVHPVGDAPASICEDILSDPVIFYPFGGLKTAFIPAWCKHYKSYLTDGRNVKIDDTDVVDDTIHCA